MFIQHLVRVGLFGHVGRFASADGVRYARRTPVVCRTARGLEVGEVLASDDRVGEGRNGGEADGTVLRRVTLEDDLLLNRLERNKQQAFRACEHLVRERKLPVVLMDVEHLFDGRALYFYFLGSITPDVDQLTAELATAYDAEVQFHRFAQTLTEGCGPGCGTEDAAGHGCGSGGCSSCAVAAACGTSGGK